MALTPEVLSVLKEDTLALLELHRRRWENTGNPLYVWLAIGLCFAFGARQTQAATGAMPKPSPGSIPYPLPPWCLLYLGTVAVRVENLTEGKDFRQIPKPFGEADPSPASWGAARNLEPTLNPAEAADIVPKALGLVRDGWNAFERLEALNAKEMDQFSNEALRFEGKSASEAMMILLQESGINDERTMRRRLAAARSARKPKPTP